MSSIVPPSGASTSTPRTETSRGLFGSNTVPSTQRSPASVRSLIETRLVKCRGRARREDVDAADLDERAVVPDTELLDARRAHLRRERAELIRQANPGLEP